MIIESGIATGDVPDLLAGGRLNALPYNGTFTVEVSANKAGANDYASLLIQKPSGDVPIDKQLIPAASAVPSAEGGVLDARTVLTFQFTARQGGHFNISLNLVGTGVVVTWRVSLSP